jgi:hypothetical protein
MTAEGVYVLLSISCSAANGPAQARAQECSVRRLKGQECGNDSFDWRWHVGLVPHPMASLEPYYSDQPEAPSFLEDRGSPVRRARKTMAREMIAHARRRLESKAMGGGIQ